MESGYNKMNTIQQHSPDEAKIKALLVKCLEEHFGSLDKVTVNINKDYPEALRQIMEIVRKL